MTTRMTSSMKRGRDDGAGGRAKVDYSDREPYISRMVVDGFRRRDWGRVNPDDGPAGRPEEIDRVRACYFCTVIRAPYRVRSFRIAADSHDRGFFNCATLIHIR